MMGMHLDSVPFSGIIRIRDMMYSVKDPFRLDQGDVSFDAPDTVKAAMQRAIDENRSHYLQTTGVPRLLERLGWRYELDELASLITPKTRAIYINSPNNPSGGVLTREDVQRIAGICRERDLWLMSDEAYEDVVFEGEHISP